MRRKIKSIVLISISAINISKCITTLCDKYFRQVHPTNHTFITKSLTQNFKASPFGENLMHISCNELSNQLFVQLLNASIIPYGKVSFDAISPSEIFGQATFQFAKVKSIAYADIKI